MKRLSLSIGEMRAIVGIVALGCLAIWGGAFSSVRSISHFGRIAAANCPGDRSVHHDSSAKANRETASFSHSGSRSSAGLFI